MGGGQAYREVENVEAQASAIEGQSATLTGETAANAQSSNSGLLDWLGLGKPVDAIQPIVAQQAEELAAQADFECARAELLAKFSTGEAPEDGKAWVSEEELDQIAATYSEIRRGKTSLSVDGDDKFKAGAMGDISTMMQTQSGRQLIHELAYESNGHTTRIGAAADPNAPKTSASMPGVPMDDDGLWKINRARTDGKTGVDSRVGYAPGHTVDTKDDGSIRSDITLFHELTHAWHNQRGDNFRGEHNGIDNDEYQCVGHGRINENLYRNERAADLGETDLEERKTYGGQPIPQ